jgi:hypothetical protein
LFGIANAVNERTKRGEPINGEWARAAKYISDYQRYTLGSLQNPDGSLSTEWFNYPADRPGDVDRKLQTSGHMLEFIVWSLPNDQLRDPRVVKCVDFISGILLANPDRAWSIGPLGHALHALIVYHQRLYNEAALPPLPIAQAEPLKTKATAAASAFEPANPASDADGSMTMSRLQKAVERPKPLSPAGSVDRGAAAKPKTVTPKDSAVAKSDNSSESPIKNSTAKTSAEQESTAPTPTQANPTAKQLADLSDGCTDSIPSSATVAQFQLAMRNLASVIVPKAISPELIEPTPPSVESDTPNEAPFDRPATSAVGP